MSSDLYQIQVVDGLPQLYQFDDGLPRLETLGPGETLTPDGENYLLKETHSLYVEVKVLTPIPVLSGSPGIFYVSSQYYADPATGAVIPNSGESDDQGSDGEQEDGPSSGDDSYFGDNGDNSRSGLTGNDVYHGYAGRDNFNGDEGSDYLDGGSDDDNLNGGADDDSLFGGDGNDHLNGGTGNDFLDGGSGNDQVDGGEGDDQFVGGHGEGNDRYNGGGGTDEVTFTSALAGIAVDLQRGTAGSRGVDDAGIGADRLTSIENVVAGEHDDLLIGSAVANVLDGRGGDDRIDGGRGADTSIGGTGADLFVISKASDTGLGSRADQIIDFSGSDGQGDRIDLSGIDAKKGFTKLDHFRFLDTAPVASGDSSNGVVWFDAAQGCVFASTDKDVQAEFAIRVLGVTHMSAADFVLAPPV